MNNIYECFLASITRDQSFDNFIFEKPYLLYETLNRLFANSI